MKTLQKLLLPFMLAGMFATMLYFSSCDGLDGVIDDLTDSLSTDEVVEGLKTALELGTDTATSDLSEEDGYYGDDLVKILLPPEADIIYDAKDLLDDYADQLGIDLDEQIENVVLSINRAAEDAASSAQPILLSAITDLTIEDGWDILNGTVPEKSGKSTDDFDSLAATTYLKNQTFDDLVTVFSTPIDESLDKELVLGTSTNDLWDALVTNYNKAAALYNKANIFLGNDDLETIDDVSLGEYCTEEALEGLFVKVGDEEKQIRENPYDWAVDIIQRVFGYEF